MKNAFLFLLLFALSACGPRGARNHPVAEEEFYRGPQHGLSDLLIPTTYRLLIIQKDDEKCDKASMKDFMTVKGQKLATVCESTYRRCLIEGSCKIIESNGKVIPIGYHKTEDKKNYWNLFDMEKCPYGKGIQGSCLDPYRTVAADTDYWKVGEVIFVPDFEGVKLADGTTHDGFFVVRDTGGAINGQHRFDFFVGILLRNDDENTFSQMKFNDKRSRFEYRKATSEETEIVIRNRAFPEIPEYLRVPQK